MLKHVILGAAALAGLPAIADAATIYANDFSADATGFAGGTLVTAPSGQQFLGNLTQGAAASLTLNTIGYSTPLTLSFDLYALLSVDGTAVAGGGDGDFFTVTVDGVATPLFNQNFANYPGTEQSFGPDAVNPRQTGAAALGTLGYTFSGIENGRADATYNISLSINPTGALTTISFIGNSNQDISDEFFGFDNVLVTGTPDAAAAVPEPATWGMMILGFGLVGAAARRRRIAVAA